MMSIKSFLMLSLSFFVLGGCSSQGDFADLQQYMDEVRAKPKGRIKPLPKFTPYEGFTYSAAGLRSPFQRPIKVEVSEHALPVSTVRPDDARIKEYLEAFNFESFSMLGSISNKQGLFGLVGGADSVHPVKVGDYLGRNHGRIVSVSEGEIHLIEIVPNGKDSWIERPRTLSLKE